DVPAQLLLGADVAASVLDEAIDRATVAWLAHGVGSMDACLEVCREYVNTRQQFGQPLGKFQALQHLLADMFVSVQESHSILFQALAQIDNADIAVRQRAVSAAKIVIGEALQFVLGQGIQLHGGYGITDEYAVSHFYKHGLVLEKLLGDSAVHVQRFIAAGKAASGKALVG
ncbi:MAG: acyl-CoA dehydrogenase family protein, partial [Spongiibacteraceae bacterium]